MKHFLTATLLAVLAAADSSQTCLYCKRADSTGGFLVSYNYCKDSDRCYKDAWNYNTRACKDGWKRGRSVPLEVCAPTEVQCPKFTSSPDKYSTYTNETYTLPVGGKCTIAIDATDAVGRVIFTGTEELGFDGAHIYSDDIISIEEGSKA